MYQIKRIWLMEGAFGVAAVEVGLLGAEIGDDGEALVG